jgi:hypothetical protein
MDTTTAAAPTTAAAAAADTAAPHLISSSILMSDWIPNPHIVHQCSYCKNPISSLEKKKPFLLFHSPAYFVPQCESCGPITK